MLFMVISTPRPGRPSKLRKERRDWWNWMQGLQASGVAKAVYVKVGRGAIVVFEVDSNEALHTLVNQWSEFIPAEFQVLPLASAAYQENIARQALRSAATADSSPRRSGASPPGLR